MQSFPSRSRLKKRSDFVRLSRTGRRFSSGCLLFEFLLSPPQEGIALACARLGITVVRKQGNSVERNRFKRRVREVFRHSAVPEVPHLALNIRARGSLPISFGAIADAFSCFEAFLQRLSQKPL